MKTPLEVLQTYWQFDAFRDTQEDIINTVLNNKNTVALLPTGGGKTICFQVPALVKEGICIVVSPLVALINEQVTKLKEKGIKAIALTGGISSNELDSLLDNAIYGNYKFLYISPERLQQEIVIERIKQMNVSLIAIDEAHCISQWGNDFRPAYRNCNILKELFPEIPTIALTASATPKVLEDIQENLGIKDAKVFKSSFARPNVAYMTFKDENVIYKTIQILRKNPGSSIIYVRNRKATKDISEKLQKEKIAAAYFHGGLSTKEKNEKLQKWLHNEIQVMVATNAFGMGIDKPDVRTVIHLTYPDSIESYFQEAGRGGRDGKKAFAVLLKNRFEEQQAIKQYISVLPTLKEIKYIYKKLNNYFQISFGEGTETNYPFQFNDFCSTYELPQAKTFQTLKLLDQFSIISLTENFREKHTIHISVSYYVYEEYLRKNPLFQKPMEAIIRTYGGIFEGATQINPDLIAKKCGVKVSQLESILNQLEADYVIEYTATKTDAEILFLVPREDDQTINGIAKQILAQQNHIKEQVKSTVHFINNDEVCKSIQLLSYFGEKNTTPCGICSVCIAQKRNSTPALYDIIKDDILKKIQTKALTSQSICSLLTYKEDHIIDSLQRMLSENTIHINDRNEYYIK
ncbi:ATP-dependent DNA helicase RecQ [Pustulibacterium marinum]|uniref:ATP-dependent DNA helicase RecQ n=1 Tax=Pustulibacterium marinum TaxID=1224947 RepID=A0A1I7HZN6_9FLAO|nr:RecQ family ATP-dependent DNA helicase [Pustulibacterium marinum]SFU66174.1 ATP-dependent DNA helicase RecQ [Pustulibacterium marinum]